MVCLLLAFFIGGYTIYGVSKDMDQATVTNYKSASNMPVINKILNDWRGNDNTIEQENTKNFVKASQGVLAGLVNNIAKEGSFLLGTLNAINQFVFSNRIMAGVIILIGAILSFLFWVFIGNTFRVSQCRFFMENRMYENTQVNRLIYIFKIRRVRNVAKIMLLRGIYTVLWSFTLVGGVIKVYSYRMIPFILAENPDIRANEAFALSRRMMHGYKWNAFKLDLSFILWHIASPFTFGLLSYFYLNPYVTATDTEFFMKLRENAKEKNYPYAERLNDIYLTLVPASAKNGQYPIELFTIQEHSGRKFNLINFRRQYSVVNIILIFFSFGMVGWFWEVCLHLYMDGAFVNRGVLLGPWLPIYGVGGVMAILLSKKWIDRPFVSFFMIILMAGIMEYATGWYLETFKGAKWWDYTGYLLNIKGRVCLEGLLVFGLAGVLGIYIMAPILDELFNKIPKKIRISALIVLVTLFIGDMIYSNFRPNIGEGITYSLINGLMELI